MSEPDTRGRRVVLWMYVSAVAVAGLFGYVLGIIVYGDGGGPAGPLVEGSGAAYGAVGPITFQLNPLNLAAFGVVSVGVLLGVGLAAIMYVSERADA
ncbi:MULTISPECIES: hypothetical protein [Halobacterium]|uniref:DUF7520 family protein n=1 Tax=Halobacterium TaxID=2239 RepID=UPI0009EC5F44|nr:hypothetical protein [Halobacterium sp. CBA1132]MCG1002417.1 hypothetical protein [Halobacterium noricense]